MANITVETLADTIDESDGLTSLREAVALANADAAADVIVFATDGTVTLDPALGEIEILAPLEIDGGGAVTLDGGGATRLLLVNDGSADTILSGLTLTGGNGAGQLNGGGAVHAIADLTLRSVTLTGNQTLADGASGGAVRVVGDLALVNSTLSGNRTAGDNAKGGAAFATGRLAVEGGAVTGNATAGAYAGGGGLAAGGALSVAGALVADNATSGESAGGGGIAGAGTVTLSGATVTGNATTGASSNGGGIYAQGSVLVEYSAVGGTDPGTGNITGGADAVGGGIAGRADVTVVSATVAGNATLGAGANGGGIYASNALSVTGTAEAPSLVAGNRTEGADAQGGAFFAALSATVAGTALLDNATAGYRSSGGAVHANGALTVTGSTLADNQTRGAYAPGGALYGGQAVTVAASTLSNNRTFGDGAGGGAISAGGALALESTELEGNATLGAGASGGAVLARADARLFKVTLERNTTEGDNAPGGALRAFGPVEIQRSALEGNATEGANSPGGALSTDGAASLALSTVEGNATSGSNAGGGGIDANGTLRLTDVGVLANRTEGAAAQGGGIDVEGAFSALRATLADNATTGDGARGGALDSNATATLALVTLAGNRTEGAQADGGALRAGGEATLVSVSASANLALGEGARGGAIFADGALALGNALVLGNAVSETGVPGTDDIGLGAGPESLATLGPGILGSDGTSATQVFAETAALLPGSDIRGGVARDNGGPLPTLALRVDGTNPALDAGDPALVEEAAGPGDVDGDGTTLTTLAFDARGGGFARVIDLPGIGNGEAGAIDLGAVELGTIARPPAALDDTVETGEGAGSLVIDALANDREGTAGTPRIVWVSIADGQGLATVAPGGQGLAYDPRETFDGLAAGETGNATLVYRIEDASGAGDTGTVTVLGTGVNDPPEARDDSGLASAAEGPAVFDVLANDADPDGDALALAGIDTGGLRGLARVSDDGTGILYDPGPLASLPAGETAVESIRHTVTDATGGTDEAVLTVVVTGSGPPARPPVARDDSVTAESGALTALDLLADNGAGADTDPDGGALAVASVGKAAHGTAILATDGTVLYRAAPGFAGTDRFDYAVEDARGLTGTARVTVAVAPEPEGGELPRGEGQRVAALYEAGLDRDGDLAGLNFWIDTRASGESLAAIAEAFLAAPEFAARFGVADSLDDEALVRQLYRNVLDREGEDPGVAFWADSLREGLSRAELLVAFADSAENLAASPEIAALDETAHGIWDFA